MPRSSTRCCTSRSIPAKCSTRTHCSPRSGQAWSWKKTAWRRTFPRCARRSARPMARTATSRPCRAAATSLWPTVRAANELPAAYRPSTRRRERSAGIPGGSRGSRSIVVASIGAGGCCGDPARAIAPCPPVPHSLAVLPFKPLVLAERDESLELGMTESLIARLSELDGPLVKTLELRAAIRRS